MAARVVLALLLLVLAPPAAADLPTVTFEGRAYVELARVATSLGGTLEASPESPRAQLRARGHVVTLTRNWSQILVDGKPFVLEAPVRVRRGAWLVPEAFLGEVVPKLRPAAVKLEDFRSRSYPSFTRLVLETGGPLTHRIEAGSPGEARVRLLGLRTGPRIEEVRDGFISEAHLERAGTDAVLRVRFESAVGDLRVSALNDPDRLVLDFLRPAPVLAPGRPEATSPLGVIVLDAGHGGHDSGAVGPGGLMEKNVALEVTKRVAKLVEERLGVKVLLTRNNDTFVTLRDRTSFANRERADLFVSIHANAHRQSVSEGVETYFLSSEATDSEARQVAALENGVVQLERPTARGKADIVKTILWDLAQSEFQLESSRLAEIVLDSMTRSLKIANRGVKQAGFYVLGGAAMPAVLVEIGFVTNPREERKLRDSRYRDEIARAIFVGIAEYKRHVDQRSRATVERSR